MRIRFLFLKRIVSMFGALDVYLHDDVSIYLWASLDMMALKLITKALFRSIKIPSSCYHTEGNGGLKKAATRTATNLPNYTYVFRSDVKSFYESINFDVLMGIVESYVKDPVLLTLLKKALMRAENSGGNFTFYDTQYHFNQSAFAKAPARHSVSHPPTLKLRGDKRFDSIYLSRRTPALGRGKTDGLVG